MLVRLLLGKTMAVLLAVLLLRRKLSLTSFLLTLVQTKSV